MNNGDLASYTTTSDVAFHRGSSLSIQGLSLVHAGGNVLFHPADFTLKHGSITGLVGTNGAGKTSLARVLASRKLAGFPPITVEYLAASDDEEYLAGSSSNHALVVDQESALSLTAMEYIQLRIRQRTEHLVEEIAALESSLEAPDVDVEDVSNKLSELYELEETLSEKVQRELHHAIEELRLTRYVDAPLQELSSGWRYKCRLVTAFLTHPDLLIIDEPSFLDEKSTEWFVTRTVHAAKTDNAIVLLISHKETLLDTLCDDILYLNAANQTLTAYHCGYSIFRSTHQLQVQSARSKIAGTEKKHKHAEKTLQQLQSELKGRERNFQQRRNKELTDKRWIVGKCKEAKQNADKSAASKVKQLKRQVQELEETRRQAQTERVKPLHLDGVPVDGRVVSLQEVGVSYCGDEDFVFENVDACMDANDRVLLMGPNGCGKSTLVKVILGKMEPTRGSVTRTANAIYFPQTALSDLLRYHGSCTPYKFLGDHLTETQARTHLGTFGLAGDLSLRPIHTLSAGQRVRLWLAKENLLHPKPSLLVVDEISENVDKDTRDSLVGLLSRFEGAVLVISHDADFCKNLKLTKRWELCRYGIRETYDDDVARP